MTRARPHVSRRLLAASAAMLGLLAVAALSEPGLVLAMAPALLLIGLLTSGVRPGEQLIERLLQRRRRARLPRAVSVVWPVLELVVRPARLFASALAVRPPPILA